MRRMCWGGIALAAMVSPALAFDARCGPPGGCGGMGVAPGCCECPPTCCDNVWAGYCAEKARCHAMWAWACRPKIRCRPMCNEGVILPAAENGDCGQGTVSPAVPAPEPKPAKPLGEPVAPYEAAPAAVPKPPPQPATFRPLSPRFR